MSLSNWTLTLNTSFGDAYDNITELGVKPDASDNFNNKYDFFEPPEPPQTPWIMVYFNRPTWYPSFTEKFNRDIRAPFEDTTKSWEFDVATSSEGEVVLSWLYIDSIPEKLSFTLVDLGTKTGIDMRTTDNYTYTNAELNHFRIDVKATVGIEAVTSVYGFALEKVSPNPFTKCANISYSIASKCKVELSLYNISGRLVKTITNNETEPGRYTVSIDSKELASGIYFLKLSAGEYKVTRKLILVK